MPFLALVLIVIVYCGISFLVSAGIIKLITLCFGIAFSWKIALGIWLILVLISRFFRIVVKSKED